MKNQLTEQIISTMNLENASDCYVKAIEIVSDVIINTGNYTENDKIAVIPMETGCGKSTITNLALAWVVRNDFSNSGTIILKERTEDCDATVEQLNELCGREVAASYHSKLFVINGKYSYKYEAKYRRNLYKYPILVMTHQGFMLRHKRLSEYLVWSDDESVFDIKRAENIKHRTRLIVDERPTTLKLFNITKDTLDDIEAHVQREANRVLFAPIFQICSYIRSNCFVKPADMQNQYWDKCDVMMTGAMEDFFYDKSSTSEEILEICVALKIFCTNGGFVNYSDESEFLNIAVGSYIDIFDKIFHSIILDGTAKISSFYKNERFNIVELPAIKTYKNTSITVCKQLNGSRYEFNNYNGILETTVAFIWNQKPQDEDALIITMKEYKEKLLTIGLPPRTSIDHYGNITGTNKYADFKFLYIVGTPYLPDTAYKIAYHTYSSNTDMNKEQRSVVSNGTRKFKDSDYNNTAASMMAAEIVQAINRVRCRKWEKGDTLHTHIFMLNKDLDVINLIETCMDGVKITYDTEFYETLPEEVRDKKPIRVLDAVLSVLSEYEIYFESSRVLKKEIFEKHEVTMNVSERTKSGIWKKPAIQQLVSDGKIRLAGKYVEFLK